MDYNWNECDDAMKLAIAYGFNKDDCKLIQDIASRNYLTIMITGKGHLKEDRYGDPCYFIINRDELMSINDKGDWESLILFLVSKASEARNSIFKFAE